MKYINMKWNGMVETIDEFETMKEAKEALRGYQMIQSMNEVYISSRCTKDWREE